MVKYVVLTVVSLLFAALHPLHVSICELDYDQERKALEITQRIFLDDLELELRKETGKEKLDIVDGISSSERDEMVKSYLKKHLKVWLSGKEAQIDYLGHEMESDAIFCYLEIKKVRKIDLVKVMNDVLLNFYEDQINLIHVSEGDKVKSMRLHPKLKSSEIDF